MLVTQFRNTRNGDLEGSVWAYLKGSKETFWKEMAVVFGKWNIPWLLGRDFDTIKFPKERC